ncbi:MAG TPA: NAD(P)H-hydrate dehydratase [Anaeromyxobacter sp.]|nr:NAD(P)H-hydrate dehydratase [Anaeromyxobacter sp.]
MRLAGAAEMRAIDRAAIEGAGIPSLALMERAGAAVAEAAAALLGQGGRVRVICGGGNNGGDGYVAARLLHGAGRLVDVLALVPAARLSPDAAAVRARAEASGVAVQDAHRPFPPLAAEGGDAVVDALFGTGLARAPEGIFAEAIAAMAAARACGARVLAVDVPSGLSADTGRPLGPCVQADRTVTFAFLKRGLAVYPGAALAGEITVADIGIPPKAAAGVPVQAELLEEEEARALLPPRRPEAHKGDAGRLLVVAGSAGKSGAAHLAVTGALRGGAGLVWLAARPEVLPLALAGRPEAMSVPLAGEGPLGPDDLGALVEAARAVDAVAIGPGIPRGPATGALIREFLSRVRVSAVLDADALNALAESGGAAGLPVPAVLTPHPGEMARLTGRSVVDVQADRLDLASASARAWGVTVVLKGARTVVADPEGPPAVIPTGNPGMATGGTGDVLAGLVGALLAGGLPPRSAGRVGAFVHGRAGDLLARRLGQRGLLAGDLGAAIAEVWAEWGR